VRLSLAPLARLSIPALASRAQRRGGRVPRRLRLIAWFFTRWSREGRTLLVSVAAAALFAADVGRTESHALVLATLALLGASLAFTRLYRLTNVTFGVRAPRRVSVGDELTITLTLDNAGERAHRSVRLETPALPRDGAWLEGLTGVTDLAPASHVVSTIRARFTKRGAHALEPFRAALLLPLGLSQGAGLETERLRFVVVPKPARVVSLTLPKSPREQTGGTAYSSRTGDASALLGVRPYRPGDPIRDLHARSWARHGSPIVREYQQETFARVGLLLDTQAAPGSTRLEAALSLGAGILSWLSKTEERLDVLAIGEHAERLAGAHGVAALEHGLDLLAAVKPAPAFNAERVLAGLGPHLERLSSLVFVALEWDEHRASVAGALRARGVGCLVIVVSDEAARLPAVHRVAEQTITQGQALLL
jgi:uncharacterized protein (DUF58 family)